MGRRYYDDDDEFYEDFDSEMEAADLRDPDGELGLSYQVLLKHQGVERTCCYCDAVFVGMPDHGVCNRCADILERGGDPC